MTSVYSYKNLADFRQFIRNLVNKADLVSSVLRGFREVYVLPKRLGQLTIEEIATKTEYIEQIYKALKKMKPETRYKLPYDKQERAQEIIYNIAGNFQIDVENTHCKILTGHYSDGERQFPWAVEITLAPLKYPDVKHAGQVTFIGSVNDTPAIDGGEKYFQSDQWAYRWIDRQGSHEVRSAMDVLSSAGFNSTSPYTSRKRHASVAYVNVKTDVPDWLGAAGKTHMNQLPYAETIAKTLVTMAHKIPSYHGQGFTLDPISSLTTSQKTAARYVDEFLIQRRKEVEANPNLRLTDRLTQRGVAYRLRPEMMADGFEPRIRWSTTMDSITNMLSQRCEMLWPNENIDREYLGIYAKARGMFYYRGRTTPIDFDAIEELASEAAVNIVIEKEGVPAVLAPYADKYSVALISTQGRFVDYVKRFVASVIDEDAIIVTILDDDKVGHEMAGSTRAINIGVNKDTIEWLRTNGYPGISEQKVQEIDPSTGEYRIEIDSILAEVGAEGLWKYIKYKIEQLAPLDLRKSIDIPTNEALYPEQIVESQTYLNEYADLVTRPAREEIKKELSESDELIDVAAKKKEMEENLSGKLANDEGMKMIANKFPKLIKELKDSLTTDVKKRQVDWSSNQI